jgi:hypothetical protein
MKAVAFALYRCYVDGASGRAKLILLQRGQSRLKAQRKQRIGQLSESTTRTNKNNNNKNNKNQVIPRTAKLKQ